MVRIADIAVLILLAVLLQLPRRADVHGIKLGDLLFHHLQEGVFFLQNFSCGKKVIEVLPYHPLVKCTTDSLIRHSVMLIFRRR